MLSRDNSTTEVKNTGLKDGQTFPSHDFVAQPSQPIARGKRLATSASILAAAALVATGCASETTQTTSQDAVPEVTETISPTPTSTPSPTRPPADVQAAKQYAKKWWVKQNRAERWDTKVDLWNASRSKIERVIVPGRFTYNSEENAISKQVNGYLKKTQFDSRERNALAVAGVGGSDKTKAEALVTMYALCAKPRYKIDGKSTAALERAQALCPNDSEIKKELYSRKYWPVSERELANIMRSPGRHKGKKIIIYGEVFQADSVTGRKAMMADVAHANTSNWGWFDGELSYLTAWSASTLRGMVEGDIFQAKVRVDGTYRYTRVDGGSATIPQFEVTSMTRVG